MKRMNVKGLYKVNYSGTDIWSLPLNQSSYTIHQLFKLLSAEEEKRAERFWFEKDRHAFITARGTLRLLLADKLNVEPEQIKFKYGRNGKPYLCSQFYAKNLMNFNLSHSFEMAVIAISSHQTVGIDIEWIRPINSLEELSKRTMTNNEFDWFMSLKSDERQHAFYKCWTRKESVLKATGLGLSYPLNQIDVQSHHSIQLVGMKGNDLLTVWVNSLDINEEYAAALSTIH